MVCDMNGKFVTSRKYPNMALIQPKVSITKKPIGNSLQKQILKLSFKNVKR